MQKSRRTFLRDSGLIAAGISLYGLSACRSDNKATVENVEIPEGLFFKISLAQWSLHKALQGGKMDNLDFAARAKNDFGIEAVEYVSQFFQDKAKDKAYTTDNGAVDINLNVSNVLITGTLSETAVTNIVLGGALEKTAFETTIMNLLRLLGGDVEFSDISGILSNLYDVQLNGTCSALSVGLVASAAVVP